MDIAEKRVYDDAGGRTRLAVATGGGLAVVGVSADVIGEFGLALAEPVADLAVVATDVLAVATGGDVVVIELDDGDDVAGVASTERTGAGPADAVAVADDALVAAGQDGIVRRAPMEAPSGADAAGLPVDDADLPPDAAGRPAVGDWTDIGEASVRAADGRLLAAADGVYLVAPGGDGADAFDHVGLDDARDVAVAGPLAATGEGCFRLGPGWTREREGPTDCVAALPAADGGLERAHAATGDELFERVDGAWTEVAWPVEAPVAGVAYGAPDAGGGRAGGDATTYAVAADGTVLVDAGDGWRTRSIGLPDVRGCRVVG